MSIEQRLHTLEVAVVRLNSTIDRLIELQYEALRRQKTVVTRPHKKKHGPQKLTRERLIELAARYERVKGEKDFDILLKVFDIERLLDLPKEDYEKFFKQMLTELHESVDAT